MRSITEILDTDAKQEGWRALLEDNAWFSDCPYNFVGQEDLYNEWCDGREKAITALGAANWAKWLEETSGRAPSDEEIAALFGIPDEDIGALLEEAAAYVGTVTDADLCNAIQAWDSVREGPSTVGEAAVALEIPLERIAQVVPSLGDEAAGFFFREDTDKPLAEQTFGSDGE